MTAHELPATRVEEERTARIVEAARHERQRLRDFIRRRVSTDEDAEDIVQDVFYQLAASYSVTAPIEKLTAWLFKVARNKVIDLYRKRKPSTPLAGDRDDSGGGPLNLEEILFDRSQSPDEVYARSVVWQELTGALDELPEEQRQVFVMHELEGKSFKEIAEETGENLNTLLSRTRYAVLFLRERLKELYDDIQQA